MVEISELRKTLRTYYGQWRTSDKVIEERARKIDLNLADNEIAVLDDIRWAAKKLIEDISALRKNIEEKS